jgi:hypothetical protein
VELSHITKLLAGIILITVPTIEFGGAFLLRLLKAREHGYIDNPVRQNLFRAGHAHAGVLVILSVLVQLLADGLGPLTTLNLVGRLGAPFAICKAGETLLTPDYLLSRLLHPFTTASVPFALSLRRRAIRILMGNN